MSEDQRNSDDSDTLTRAGAKSGPMDDETRLKKQTKFIAVYRECGNIKYACKMARIARSTFYKWRDTDEAFQSQLPDADKDADETLEYAGYERAVKGVLEPIVSQGQLVYEMIPQYDKDGELKYKDGKPQYKRGKQIMKRVYSDTLLITLLKARMPQKYKDNKAIEHTGANGGPIRVERNSDLALLNDDELDLVEQTLRNAKERQS